MLAAICVTVIATSALKCDVAPNERVRELIGLIVPGGRVFLVQPKTGELAETSQPFIVREGDSRWMEAKAAAGK